MLTRGLCILFTNDLDGITLSVRFLKHYNLYLRGAQKLIVQETSDELLLILRKEEVAVMKQARKSKLTVDQAVNLAIKSPLIKTIFPPEEIQHAIDFAKNCVQSGTILQLVKKDK